MFDWIGDLIDAIAEAIREAFEFLGTQISNTIWNTMLRWFYETIYDAVADFFTMMGNMGADIFALDWVQATIKLFTLFGWSLFAAGLVALRIRRGNRIPTRPSRYQDNVHQYP